MLARTQQGTRNLVQNLFLEEEGSPSKGYGLSTACMGAQHVCLCQAVEYMLCQSRLCKFFATMFLQGCDKVLLDMDGLNSQLYFQLLVASRACFRERTALRAPELPLLRTLAFGSTTFEDLVLSRGSLCGPDMGQERRSAGRVDVARKWHVASAL